METPELTHEQKQYDMYCRLREERKYWKERCLLAEKIAASLNDKVYSVTDTKHEIEYLEQIEAYNDFLSNNKEPK